MRHKRFTKELTKELVLEKAIRREVFKQPLPEVKNRAQEVKLVAREGFDPFSEIEQVVNPAIDPVVVESLGERLTRLEGEVFPKSATFIRANERPVVAQHMEEETEGPTGPQV